MIMDRGPSKEVGSILAGLARDNQSIRESAIYDEADNDYLVTSIDSAQLTTTVYVIKQNYPTTSFIIDHPVYGDIDSSILEIDGGYASGGGNQFPLTFPIIWEVIEGSSLIGSYTS